MSAWIWVLIPLVAIIGGYIIDYQKNKLKWQNQTTSNEAELDEVKGMLKQLRSRVENLEAIAAGDPAEFTGTKHGGLEDIEVDESNSMKDQNQSEVAYIANKQR
ncbi:MAG: hypothetical protein R6V27_04290 [Balneolaceae bacterium]